MLVGMDAIYYWEIVRETTDMATVGHKGNNTRRNTAPDLFTDRILMAVEWGHWELLWCKIFPETHLYSLRPRQNGRHFTDDIFKCIFLNENVWISLKLSLKFVPKVRIDVIPALVQIMAGRRPGDKPLSGPMMVNLLTHICVTRLQLFKFKFR